MAEWKNAQEIIPRNEGIYKVQGFTETDQGKHKYETRARLKIIDHKPHWYDLSDEQSEEEILLDNVIQYKPLNTL